MTELRDIVIGLLGTIPLDEGEAADHLIAGLDAAGYKIMSVEEMKRAVDEAAELIGQLHGSLICTLSADNKELREVLEKVRGQTFKERGQTELIKEPK